MFQAGGVDVRGIKKVGTGISSIYVKGGVANGPLRKGEIDGTEWGRELKTGKLGVKVCEIHAHAPLGGDGVWLESVTLRLLSLSLISCAERVDPYTYPGVYKKKKANVLLAWISGRLEEQGIIKFDFLFREIYASLSHNLALSSDSEGDGAFFGSEDDFEHILKLVPLSAILIDGLEFSQIDVDETGDDLSHCVDA